MSSLTAQCVQQAEANYLGGCSRCGGRGPSPLDCLPLPFVVRFKPTEQCDCLIRQVPIHSPPVHTHAHREVCMHAHVCREEDGALEVESDKDGAYVTLEGALASILALPSQVRDVRSPPAIHSLQLTTFP